jgi:hypothetical protein
LDPTEKGEQMARAIVQCSMLRDGLIPEDAVVNTWHFENDGTFQTDEDGLLERLHVFYVAIGGLLAATLVGELRVRMYDYSEPKPRVPRTDDTVTFTPASDALPAELAICLSMSGDQVSGGKKARRRGRVYLGPLSGNVLGYQSGKPDVRVSQVYRDQIVAAAEDLATGGAGSYRLAVFSPTTVQSGGTDDEAWNDVTKVWVDDAFDIQRRRGAIAAVRSEASIS